jgi:hypothetical protein
VAGDTACYWSGGMTLDVYEEVTETAKAFAAYQQAAAAVTLARADDECCDAFARRDDALQALTAATSLTHDELLNKLCAVQDLIRGLEIHDTLASAGW